VVLVDTSLWIDHLRAGHQQLQALLNDDTIFCHPYIIGELACGNLGNRDDVLALLQALPTVPVLVANEFVFSLDRNRLMDCGIGFVDVHLLASARLAGVSLWTKDRHLRAAAAHMGVSYPS
jgi:predicted nucleic acid-binding protein